MSNKPALALEQLAAEIGGVIEDDRELYYGPPEHQIFIHEQDDGRFGLASEHPLYEIKKGKARRVRPARKGTILVGIMPPSAQSRYAPLWI